jgi:DNA-directed RNA polymerase subunit RPC12/RpoP
MWDRALTVLSSIAIIVVGSVAATFVLRRFERGTKFFGLPHFPRQRHSLYSGNNWIQLCFYIGGMILIVLGCLIIVPTMTRASHISDVILLVGAPVVMNGITLVFYGIIVLAFGRIVDLLSRSTRDHVLGQQSTAIPGLTPQDNGKVLVACPNCGQQMRIPAGNTGTMKCARCSTGFDIQQAII